MAALRFGNWAGIVRYWVLGCRLGERSFVVQGTRLATACRMPTVQPRAASWTGADCSL
jgi:hypothetical protein